MAADMQNTALIWQERAVNIGKHLLKRWYLLVLALIAGGGFGYYRARKIKPTYTASISFVLSTDQRGGGGFANLAAQLGFDAMTGNAENIFSGDNIIELFKSRKIISSALLLEVDKGRHLTLLNLIAQRQFPKVFARTGSMGNDPSRYSVKQRNLYRNIVGMVGRSVTVFKKDKKLIVYLISANSTDPDVAYHSARLVLDQTSRYFIETKTKVAVSSVKLLQHEADSLAGLLKASYQSTAATIDRTFNLNPSISIQRSGTAFSQAKAVAYAAAYTEVMRNLEVAKINLQKETPLYRIIDEPELPLYAAMVSKKKYILSSAVIALLLVAGILIAEKLYKLNKDTIHDV